jgi:hypothetical protein
MEVKKFFTGGMGNLDRIGQHGQDPKKFLIISLGLCTAQGIH